SKNNAPQTGLAGRQAAAAAGTAPPHAHADAAPAPPGCAAAPATGVPVAPDRIPA
ncbi:hypothetical protein OEF71_002982, partial [Listeria monocytogenes]|nr:hypothetical protein [Listeria monocytogenes]